MSHLIRNRRVEQDTWLLLEGERWLRAGEDGLVPDFPAGADLIVPVEVWRGRRSELIERGGRLGVLVNGHDEPKVIAEDLGHYDLIAVHIPKFPDGRAKSLARLLRERHGFHGELRATGDVLRDHLHSLERCGFDSFNLRDDQDPQEALTAFDDFTEDYQASVAHLPLFRRRLARTAAAP